MLPDEYNFKQIQEYYFACPHKHIIKFMQGVDGLKIKLLLTCMLIFFVSGCSTLAGVNKVQTNNEQPVMAEKKEAEKEEVKDEKVDIQLYFGDSESALLKKEERAVRLKDVVADAPRVIVLELMKGPQDKDLFPVIPAGTKLLSIKKEGDTVTVNFSKEFRDNHNGGSSGETVTIYAIVNSLTEIKDIERVSFQIEGKAEKEFKGHYEFDKPFVRDESLTVK